MARIALDAADIRILSALQQHGALSKTKLAERVNLSPTPCWVRFERLKKAGLIRGYHADVALDRILDATRVVVTVSLKRHQQSDFDRFEQRIAETAAITECIATGGGMDYVMKVITPTLAGFQALMEELLAADLQIDRYMTYIVTRDVKSARPDIAGLLQAAED